jgi:phage-related protein
MATVTSKALFRGAATTTTTTTLYTVPASTTAVVTNIAVTNTGASAYTFTIKLDDVDIHTTTAISANSTVYIDCKQVLATTKTIKGGASNAAVNFHISGVEIA